MARIPTPSTQGAQNIGSVGVSRNSNAPFQNLSAPDMTQQGKLLQTAGRALREAGGDFAAMADQQQKRDLLSFEAEEAILRGNLNSALQGLSGQELVDAIEGENGVLQRYEQGLSELRRRFGSSLSDTYAQTLDQAARLASVNYTNQVTGQQIEAQLQIDEQLVTGRIAQAATAARAAAGSLAQEQAIEAGLAKIAQSVTDPDMGLAGIKGISEEEVVTALVKQQQAILLQGVVEELQAQGKHRDAAALVRQHTADGGILDGTVIGTQLQTSIQTQADLQRGTDNFEDYLADTNGDPAAVLNRIMAIEDATEQGQTLKAFNAYMSARATVERAQIGDAITYLQSYAASNNGSIEGIDVNRIMPVLKHQPQVLNAFAYGARQRQVADQQGQQAGFEAHVAANGAERPSSIIQTSLEIMAKEDPSGFMELKPETLRPLLNWEQYQEIISLRTTTQERINSEVTKGRTTSYDTAITSLSLTSGGGQSSSSGRQLEQALSSSGELRAEFAEWTRQIIEDTGNPPTSDQYRAKMAEYALRVVDEVGYVTDTTSPYILSQQEKNGREVYDAPLETDGRRQQTLLAFALNTTQQDVEAAIEQVQDSGRPVTLNTLRAQLGQPLAGRAPSLSEGERAQRDFEDAALGMGYNPDFMLWAAGELGLPMNSTGLNEMARKFSSKDGQPLYQTMYEAWVSQ
jgi:hypothetical protein